MTQIAIKGPHLRDEKASCKGSISVAAGEQLAWLGCRQHASPRALNPLLLSGEWGSPGRTADALTVQGWTALHSQLLFPSAAAEKGSSRWEQRRDGGTCGAGPSSGNTLKPWPQLTAPQALAWLLPSPNSLAKGSHTSPMFPWDTRAGASWSPVPVWTPLGSGPRTDCCPGTNPSQKTGARLPDHQQPLAVDTSPDG